MQTTPTLETRLSGYGKTLGGSFFSAVGLTAAVCAVLALIVQVHEVFTAPPEEHQEQLVMEYVEPETVPAKPVPSLAPERMITVPSGPAMSVTRAKTTPTKAPEFVEMPEVAEPTPDLLVFENTETENPFADKKPAKPAPEPDAKPTPARKATAVASKTTPRKPTGPSAAELKRREQDRLASLARKITQQAAVISRSTPSYPKSARRAGLEGRVVVTVTVGSSGRVASCQVSKSSGHSSLDRSALSAAKRYRFRPAKNGLGQAVTVQKAIPFNFQLAS